MFTTYRARRCVEKLGSAIDEGRFYYILEKYIDEVRCLNLQTLCRYKKKEHDIADILQWLMGEFDDYFF